MDPKMDSGFLLPGEKLHDDYDVLREPLPEEVLGIIDQMICYEVNLRMLQLKLLRAYPSLDGMASGLSIVSDALHITLHRQTRFDDA